MGISSDYIENERTFEKNKFKAVIDVLKISIIGKFNIFTEQRDLLRLKCKN